MTTRSATARNDTSGRCWRCSASSSPAPGFSIFEGLLSLTRSHHENPLAAYVTLAVAFVAEGTSFVRAFWQVRGEAGGRSEEVLGHVKSSPDITVKVALFEDSAAVGAGYSPPWASGSAS